jgi:shikimate dehydrogenase
VKSVYTISDLRDWKEATEDCDPPMRLAVIGEPIAHSKSPQMHNAALLATNTPVGYTRLLIRPGEVEECLELLPEAGFIGINCTIPHKATVLANVHVADTVAKRAGGVNTVMVREDGTLEGTSTDGPGFARAVEESFGVSIGKLHVMVLGAGGGAGRAVAMQCASFKCPSLTLINRSLEKLNPMLDDLAQFYPEDQVDVGHFDEAFFKRTLPKVDLVVNCTPIGMQANDASPIPQALIEPRHLIYDTVYVDNRTPLLLAADAVGARGENGLSMLLHQGALSFERWFGQPAPLDRMRRGLTSELW